MRVGVVGGEKMQWRCRWGNDNGVVVGGSNELVGEVRAEVKDKSLFLLLGGKLCLPATVG